MQGKTVRKLIRRRLRGQMHIIIQLKHLLPKRRVIRQDPHRILINPNPFFYRLYDNRSLPVRNDPMKLRHRKILAKRGVRKVYPLNQGLRLLHRSALAQNPWDKFKRRHIVFLAHRSVIYCIPHKIQARHAKPLLIDRVIIQRASVFQVRRADHGIMALQAARATETKIKITGHDRNLLPVRKLIIQRTSKIEIFCKISQCCTHSPPPSFYPLPYSYTASLLPMHTISIHFA